MSAQIEPARSAMPPPELAALPFWLVWKLVPIPGRSKPSKVPFYVGSGRERSGTQGTDEDRAQLVTYAEAAKCLAASNGYYTGVGFALQPDAGIVALDFDDCVVDGKIAQHVEHLCAGTYTEFSPSGNGVRAFFRGTLMSKKDVKAERGPFPIEVFGHNGFVTYTANVTQTCALFGWDDTMARLTPAVLEMYRARGWDDTAAPGAVSANPLAALQPTLDITDAEVAEWLQKLDPALCYDDWVKVGMAVHQQTHGQGFALWHGWSTQSPKYVPASGEKFNRERWVSFGNYTGGAHVTFAWVIKLARETQAHGRYEAVADWKRRIAGCADEFTLRHTLTPDISDDQRLEEMEREALAQALYDRFRALGTKYPIATCRKLIAQRVEAESNDFGGWLTSDWVYVTADDKFFRIDSEEWLSRQGFNARYNRFQPKNEIGAAIKNAADVALDEAQIACVTRAMYLPTAGGTFAVNGVECVNTYRPSTVPRAADYIDDDGQRAIDLVSRHVKMICGGREYVAGILIAWMAHNIQKPGSKIRWAPLIKGVEGDGKSLLGRLLAGSMGEVNVKQISPTVLATDFTDWAHGACVGVLEEIRLTGHNRHDILNALKPYVTNDSVPIHPKGKPEFTAINTMNYLAFTNHADALPLTDTDRRWMIVFSPFSTIEGLRQEVGMDTAEYFTMVFDAIRDHADDLRRWLLDYPIPTAFNPNGNAPHTDEKAAMVGLSMSPEEEVVRDVIEDGAEGVARNVLSATCLVRAARSRDSDLRLNTNALNRLLARMGWRLVVRMKWNGQPHRVWTRGEVPSDNDALRLALDATLPVIPTSVEAAAALFDSVPNSVPAVLPL